jgi:putative transposase
VPRKSRIDAAGAIQHVIARGNAGMRIVLDDDDRRTFLSGLARAAERHGWLIHAYCLMDTHIHVVVETPDATLSAGMRRWIGGYAYEFNRRHGLYGHVFAGPFSAKLIETEAYAIEACAYVVANPVSAGLVREPADWPWSSYRATAGLVRLPSSLSTRLVPDMLHSERSRAQELYRQLVDEAIQHRAQAKA